jgi:ATP/maltotriose-dependent transcriptional regulator MalT
MLTRCTYQFSPNINLDTVKRHVSHIFSKLGVTNRVQAVKQAHDLGLLDEQF